jgi:protein tyrosine phosphatase (PTP) superfamily phosphohydrolase (DUF442 family)
MSGPQREGNMAPSLNQIRNYVQLTDHVGTSGQPTRDEFKSISEAGFDAVVNLALPSSDGAIADEGSIVTGLGMRYVHIPVVFERPTLDDLRLFIATMRTLEGRRVWVHCVVNARVSAFMFHYLRFAHDYPPECARSPILDAWEPQMDDVWRRFMEIDRADIG